MEQQTDKTRVAIIGAGPAGLMAAEAAATAGCAVALFDQMPSPARKFLMAGQSGLNITKIEDGFVQAYACPQLIPFLDVFGPEAVRSWMDGLEQESFVGSTGRVFPKAMKASPLLRAWLGRLDALGVVLHRRARWTGWNGAELSFADGTTVRPAATVLALGGASWRRLGSDGTWAGIAGLAWAVTPFLPANVGFKVDWSPHMARHFGAAVKNSGLVVRGVTHRGEFTVSAQGIEGGGLYPLTPALRDGAALVLDLKPDLTIEQLRDRLARRGKDSLPNHLRKALRLTPVQIALVQELARPLPDDLAQVIKRLPLPLLGPRPMDEAISTAGGLRWEALDPDLMLRDRPGTFAAGEMLDWEAPTGGYLLTACLSTGWHAGRAAAAPAQAVSG